jgi:hypothetical protein
MLLGMQGLDSLRDWAEFVVDNFRSFDCCGGCPLGSLGSEVAEYDELARQAVSASLGLWEGVLRDGLTKLIETGALGSTADPDALAVVLIVALEGGLLLGKIHRSSRPLEIALGNVRDRGDHVRPEPLVRFSGSQLGRAFDEARGSAEGSRPILVLIIQNASAMLRSTS